MPGAIGRERRQHFEVGSTSCNLLNGARAKDQVAWRRLAERYEPMIRECCRSAGLQADLTDDIVQEVLFSVSSALGRYRPLLDRGSFRRWLSRIIENKIKDHFRRSQKHPTALGGTDAILRQQQIPDQVPSNESDWHQFSNAKEDVMTTLEMIQDQFSVQTWRAFYLVTFCDYTSSEAASELKTTGNAVRLANGRVRSRLRELIGPGAKST